MTAGRAPGRRRFGILPARTLRYRLRLPAVARSPTPPPFVAACVQFDVHRGEVERNLAAAEAGLRAAAAAGARLAVLPEVWTTSIQAAYGAEIVQRSLAAEARLQELSRTLGMVVVGGGIESEEGRIYNVARVVAEGRVLGTARKIHLFSPNGEDKVFTAGERPLLVETPLGRIGVAICYDLRFPELVRWFFAQRAEVLCVPAQWPEARAEHWLALSQARAIENQLFLMACNRTGREPSLKRQAALHFPGNSRIVDPTGEILARGNGEDEPVLATLDLARTRMIRRLLPIERDRRPEVYERIWGPGWRPLRG